MRSSLIRNKTSYDCSKHNIIKFPMKEAKCLNGVARFHEVFKHAIDPSPTIPAQERCNLRVDLLQEELNELKKAIEDQNITEVADALCDIQYVLSGAILEFGIGNKFADLFDEVQRSNMSKACKTEEEAKNTIDSYALKGIESYYQHSDGKFLVYRKNDNKTLKSVNYSPANLTSILADT